MVNQIAAMADRMDPVRPSSARGADALIALAVGLLLTLGWTIIDWSALAQLRLPDTDDMMRLAQIRDWLDGQGFTDLSQYRLGPGGLAMHWSRLPDLFPGALIAMLAPALGRDAAELVAVIAWPAALFILYLWLTAKITRRICDAAEAPVAIVVAALSYPAISLFIPGRIDHHGLQIVLLLVILFGLVGRPSARAGALAGTAAMLSIVVGLETAPAIVAAMAALLMLWCLDGGAEKGRMIGFGAALLATLALSLLFFRPLVWPIGWCDSFTLGVSIGSGSAGIAWLALGSMTPWLQDWRLKIWATVLLAVIAGGAIYAFAPACLASPYGSVDPLVARIWLSNVGEAGGVLAQRPGTLLAYLGLPLVGVAATIAHLCRDPGRRPAWGMLLMVQVASLAVAWMQLRGAYVAAALAAPSLAHLIVVARGRGLARLAVAWFLSAGLVWQQLGTSIGSEATPQVAPSFRSKAGCTDPATLTQIGRLPAGMLAAPIDMGAFVVGMTRHRILAAPYHRNNRGNRAMYDFFLATPEAARFQAGLWSVDYVAICPDSFAEVPSDLIRDASLARQLQRGAVPDWLSPVLMLDSEARLYRVLPPSAASR